MINGCNDEGRWRGGERREAKNPASNTGERAWTAGNTGSGETIPVSILANKIKDFLYITFYIAIVIVIWYEDVPPYVWNTGHGMCNLDMIFSSQTSVLFPYSLADLASTSANVHTLKLNSRRMSIKYCKVYHKLQMFYQYIKHLSNIARCDLLSNVAIRKTALGQPQPSIFRLIWYGTICAIGNHRPYLPFLCPHKHFLKM